MNVSDDIKIGTAKRDEHIDNYIKTLQALGEADIHMVCYNFMPVFDWTRTELARVLKNQLHISVTNATKDAVRKLDSEYITTKRGNHGHGLKRINLVVEKYEGYINRQNEPGVFVTEIMLPL